MKNLIRFIIFVVLIGLNNPGRAQNFTFDTDTEGWTTNADGSDPIWESTGGNPGGWISAFDISTGGTWHWVAPPVVLGNACGAYGLKLSFDIKTSQQVTNNTKADIILQGDGLTIVYNLEYDPLTVWTNFSVIMKEDAGWRMNNVNGPIPTKAQFVGVLQNLSSLQIRGEYLQQAEDYGGLDNVILGQTAFGFDLDENDSTTPPNSKNFVQDSSCSDGSKICDLDLQLLSESGIDSVVVQLVTPPDGNKEFLALTAPLSSAGPIVTGAGTRKIVLLQNGQSTPSLFRQALQAIIHRDTAFPSSQGVRLVQVTVYTVCGPLGQAVARIPYFPPASAGEDGTTEFCPGDAASDLKNYLGGQFSAYGYWEPAFANGTTFDPAVDSNRVFLYIVSSGSEQCPSDTAQVTVRVATPLGDLGKDTLLCRENSLKLTIPLQPEYSQWTWSTGSTSTSILITSAGTYGVTVTSEVNNCVFSDEITVDYVNCEECKVYVPNAFSPDDDGDNDHFLGFSNCPFLTYHLRVFDRWGNMVFETNTPDGEWDGDFRGKSMAPGVFIWLLDYETEFLGQPLSRRLQGDVTLVK